MNTQSILRILIFLLSLTCILYACQSTAPSPEEQTATPVANVLQLSEAQLQHTILSFTEIAEKSMDETRQLNGKIEIDPAQLVSVSTAFGGRVQSIHLLPGAHFKKGQVIAFLEDPQFIQLQQEYLSQKALLKQASLHYHRQKELNQQQAVSDKTFQQAEADYQTAYIQTRALEEKLKLIHIVPGQVSAATLKGTIKLYAPFDGLVSRVLVNRGQYVSATEPLFELINPQGMLLRLNAFEKELSSLNIGQAIEAYTHIRPEEKWKARILTVGSQIAEDGTTPIYARFEGKIPPLVAGTYMNAVVQVQHAKRLVLPDESVVSYENKPYVFEVLKEGNFRLTSVHTGLSREGYVHLIDGDKLLHRKIVVKGAYDLLMALKNKSEEE